MMKQMTWHLATAAILLSVAMNLGGCAGSIELDEEVVGVYKTTDDRYGDRSFQIRAHTIAFGIGDGGHDRFEIEQIKRSLEGDRTFYTVYFANADGENFQISFYYDSDDGGTIAFKHQQDVLWKKDRRRLKS